MEKFPPTTMFWNANNIGWQEIAPDGTKYALLEGRRDVPGQSFSYAFFIPAGFWDPPHWHSADARVFVLKGTLYLGFGDTHDDKKLQAFSTGSYLIAPANVSHFDGSHEDTIIIGTAVGPWSTHYLVTSS